MVGVDDRTQGFRLHFAPCQLSVPVRVSLVRVKALGQLLSLQAGAVEAVAPAEGL